MWTREARRYGGSVARAATAGSPVRGRGFAPPALLVGVDRLTVVSEQHDRVDSVAAAVSTTYGIVAIEAMDPTGFSRSGGKRD